MSAVIAGKLMHQNSDWKNLNSGMLVVEPSRKLFARISAEIGQLHSSDGGDQGFLHSYYNEWPTSKNLHLDDRFNAPFCYLDEYCQFHNYHFEYKRKVLKTNIAVIHFWGKYKPWNINLKSLKRKSDEKWEQSLLLWWDTFLEASK